MKVDELERLLAAFYDGMTDEQEEERLKEAFKSEELPASLQGEREVFLALCDAAEKETDAPLPAGMEERLAHLIDERAEEEQRFFRRNKARRNWRWVIGVAATLLLVLGIGYGRGIFRATTPRDTFSDPEQAYQVLQATLLEVSRNLNEGIAQVEATRLDVAKVNQEVKREIQR